MGTKRPSCTIFDTSSNINMSDRKLQPGGKISRDPSPRPAMTAQLERDRDGNRDEDRRRETDVGKNRDKARYKDTEPRERHRERVPASTLREGERDWRERERRQEDDRSGNGRTMSNVDRGMLREMERVMKKGDTFPKMRQSSKERDRRMMSNTEIDDEIRESRQRDRPRRMEIDERKWQRERYGERERDGVRSRAKEEGKRGVARPVKDEDLRKRDRYQESDGGFQDRGREAGDSWDRRERERDTARKGDKSRPNMSDREAQRDRDFYSNRKEREAAQRREGKRDTRSEGDSDERELRKEKVRDREGEELIYQHSRSEGENTGRRLRDRDGNRQRSREGDRPRDRDRERDGDTSKRRGVEKDRERDREEDRSRRREKDPVRSRDRGWTNERRDDDRYREYEQRDKERRERGANSRGDDTKGRSSRSPSNMTSRAPPRSQSSGEWSSDMDSETRYRRGRDSYEERESGRESTAESERDAEESRDPRRAAERERQSEQIRNERKEKGRGQITGSVPEQRRMWLEPQRGKNSEEDFANRERHTRQKERRREEEGSMVSQAERGREVQQVKEEPDERYADYSSYRKRHAGRNEYGTDMDKETEGLSVDGDEAWRETDKGGTDYLSDSSSGMERGWQRDTEGENTDNTEESGREEEGGTNYLACSEKGSETVRKQERDSMLSVEDGFVTVSSGGDEDDDREEEFEDCKEFWQGGSSPVGCKGRDGDKERPEGRTVGQEEDQGREKQPKYVFCVIGQTLPRSRAGDKSLSQFDQMGGDERNESHFQMCHNYSNDIAQHPQDDQRSTVRGNDDYLINNQDTEGRSELKDKTLDTSKTTEEDMRYRSSSEPQDPEAGEEIKRKVENPYDEIGPFISKDAQTERLLIQWREKNKDRTGKETTDLSGVPGNRDSNVFSQADFEKLQPILDGIKTGVMSPEEVEAIRIRLSGAWSMSEEPKRHSQAPHLKWAKDVVREILGQSEEFIEDETNAKDGGEQMVDRPEMVMKEDKWHEEVSEPELEEGEPLELEGLRDDEDDRSKSWGEVELRNVLDTIDRRKRNSKFFNAAQLYQQYSEAAQNFEILRQARSDVLSVCEDNVPSPAPSPPPARRPLPPLPPVPHPHSLSHTGSVTSVKSLPLPEPPKSEGRPSSPRLSVSLTQSATLWRDLPGVRNSGQLEELTEDQRRLQEVRFEVLTSEASYCRSLDIVVEHFVKSKQLGALLTTQDRNWLFSRLADVRAISHSFLSKLEERMESNIVHFTVCDIIARHCQRFKMVYVPYLTNQSYQDATYQRLMNENPGFRRIVEKLERSPVCQRLPLRSFLVLPFQRITRIKLLVQNIVKRTTPGTAEATQAIKALKLLEKLIQESNDSISQMKSIESLVCLSAKVDFECRTLPLISQSRRLVREGAVTELMDFSLKDTERNIYMHLFNDYLLISLQKEGGKFTVIDHSPVSELRVENCRVKLHSLQKNLFRLHIPSHKSLLLRTDTLSDKLRWISAISRPHPEIDFSAAQDFPQMQCIRAFVGQQPDELSLEKADIILVHQQSSDHWVEGTRLSDRQRGWVPESHLEIISNSRVRQRNLSDALKLTTATAAV
ncbi:trichohyalin-like isoform X2 [Solea senegalensis]|uniref:Trichohyalin-like isoform X2 n=1 Tax=Solea senegalensis TaxID=28829 RepID=A0AAV6PNY8_SOLSE|nr:zinc finger CCCH domain-containing protein 13 isoform X2 [Solea senegalensis]KAG7474367.1 trichohyalin-like isoform X2 [Solea senegalensis]